MVPTIIDTSNRKTLFFEAQFYRKTHLILLKMVENGILLYVNSVENGKYGIINLVENGISTKNIWWGLN